MKEIGLALLAGIIVGIVFKSIKLPLPAPPVMAGIVGIVGIYLGGLIADKIFQLFLIK
jgi:XapX domain-containing protein